MHKGVVSVSHKLSRRSVLRLAGVSVLAATGAIRRSSPALASPINTIQVQVEDFGPGVSAYSLMKGLLVGDTFFVGSRNLTPTRAIGYHVPTRKVICTKEFGPGWTVQALAQHGGSVVYAGLVGAADGEPNIWKWDLMTTAVTPLATIDGLFVRALATAPDGMLYAVGKEDGPGIHAIDPRTGSHRVLAVPDPHAVQARCLSVTHRYVFVGAGSNLAGGGDASSASVFVVNRVTGECRSLLPPALAADPATRDLAVIGKRLYVGTESAIEHGWFAVFSLADYTLEFSVRTQAKWCANFLKIGRQVYCNGGGLWRDDPATRKSVRRPDTDRVVGWGLGHCDGAIVAANDNSQAMVHYQLATRTVESVDLVDAGATPAPQLGMSVAADRQRVYVGGTGSVDLHRLADASVRKLWIPGECKDMVIVDGMLVAGVYSSRGIWSYDPKAKHPPAQLIPLPQELNRPRALVWDAFHDLLLVGIQSDTLGGGALAVCDLHRQPPRIYVNPLPDLQYPRALAAAAGLAYLGGDNAQPGHAKGYLACWDVLRGEARWTFDPGFGQGVSGLVVADGKLFGLTVRGQLFVVDPATQTVVHSVTIRALSPSRGRLIVSRGQIYGGSSAAVFHVNSATYAVTPMVTGLHGEWFDGARLAADTSGALYTLKGRHLIRIRPEDT